MTFQNDYAQLFAQMDMNNSAPDILFDIEKLKQAYAYLAFSNLAKATGGIMDSSANPEYLFQKASNTSKNYYLLYYTPKSPSKSGQFKNIKVKVKKKLKNHSSLRVLCEIKLDKSKKIENYH